MREKTGNPGVLLELEREDGNGDVVLWDAEAVWWTESLQEERIPAALEGGREPENKKPRYCPPSEQASSRTL